MALYVNADHKKTPWKADAALMALPNTTRQVRVPEAIPPAELLLLPPLPLTSAMGPCPLLPPCLSFISVKSRETVFSFVRSLGCLDENHRTETYHFVQVYDIQSASSPWCFWRWWDNKTPLASSDSWISNMANRAEISCIFFTIPISFSLQTLMFELLHWEEKLFWG